MIIKIDPSTYSKCKFKFSRDVPNAREARNIKRHPTIEDDVIIYANATILGDITIGKGATIGGNSWVTEDVPPGTLVTFRS